MNINFFVLFLWLWLSVDKIGWISRQKYEEIWMSLLGILNLSTEGEIRPEEQASIVQVCFVLFTYMNANSF